MCSHYDPNGIFENAIQTLNYNCYSSWHFPNEITDRVVGLSSAPLYGTQWQVEYGINGFFAIGRNAFVTDRVSEPWLELDFGQVVQIQKVITKLHSDPAFPTRYCYVEVRVGNISGSGDYSSATVLDYYPQIGVHAEVVVFEGTVPLWGRYLSFQSLDTVDTHLIIGNIDVLGKA